MKDSESDQYFHYLLSQEEELFKENQSFENIWRKVKDSLTSLVDLVIDDFESELDEDMNENNPEEDEEDADAKCSEEVESKMCGGGSEESLGEEKPLEEMTENDFKDKIEETIENWKVPNKTRPPDSWYTQVSILSIW
jgi:hypothetical protein